MTDLGVKSPNITATDMADSVLVNRNGNTRQIPVPSLAKQLAGSGAVADAVAAAAVAQNGRIATLEQNQTLGKIVAASWSDLASLAGTVARQGAEVLDSDTGTHTDPVVGGTVANAGTYQWSAAPAGWKRIGTTGLSTKADKLVLDQGRVSFPRPLVIQRDTAGVLKLLIPNGNAYRGGKAGFYAFGPAAGRYIEAPMSLNSTVSRHAFSFARFTANGSADALVSTTVNVDTYDADDQIPIAISVNGMVHSPYAVIGEGRGGTSQNQFRFARDPSAAPRRSNATVTPITETEFTALGITQGITAAASPFYGDDLVDQAPNPYYYFRLLVQSAVSDSFGAPIAYINYSDGTQSGVNLSLEKKISSNAAIYSAQGRLSTGKIPTYYWVGGNTGGNDIRFCGLQAAIQGAPVAWIDRWDYPTPQVSPVKVFQSNMFPYGLDPTGVSRLNGATSIVDITDSNLTALGFTKGVGGNNGTPFYGMDAPYKQGSYKAFGRVFVQSDQDDSFGSLRMYVFYTDGTSQAIMLNQEKRLSARAASYYGKLTVTSTKTVSYFWIGILNGATGRDMRLCGAQMYVGPLQCDAIDLSDYPAPLQDPLIALAAAVGQFGDVTPDFSVPSKLWLATGRKLPFYPQNALSTRTEADSIMAHLSSIKASAASLPYLRTGRQMIEIDPDRIGSTIDFTVRRIQGSASTRYLATMAASIATSVAGSPKILMIGDSLFNRKIVAYLNAKLNALGLTPSFVGTINAVGATAAEGANADTTGPLAEAREGREFADFVYDNTDDLSPIAVGDEAAYLAMSKAGKAAKNPFIRAAVDSDPADRVFNGYIFDMAFYLARFSLATPDFVIIGLGTNDISQQTSTEALRQVQIGLDTMVKQTRAALPNAKIGLVQHMIGRSTTDTRWAMHHKIIREHIKFVATLADPKVALLPCYLHQSMDAGWSLTLGSTDSYTGLQTNTISDIIHVGDLNRQIAAEVISNWVRAD